MQNKDETERGTEREYEQYLLYLYELASYKYADCGDVDSLVSDTVTALLEKRARGEVIDKPKGFLSAVMKHKYTDMLRRKYADRIMHYGDDISALEDVLSAENAEDGDSGELAEEYERVRREISRLLSVYREVTVRHYMHGHSVKRIAEDLGISEGTVKSRLSSSRERIREGLQSMEKYGNASYEPKTVSMGIFGSTGYGDEPLTHVKGSLEANVLILAYEKPVTLTEIADNMGMPTAYVEEAADKLVEGELMGKTSGGLYYTRCYMVRHRDSFGNVEAQEQLAYMHADDVWNIVWRNMEPLTKRDEFAAMTEKQKATLILHFMREALNNTIVDVHNEIATKPSYPDRPNGGRWLAMATIYDKDEKNTIYDASGPVQLSYYGENGIELCRMFDCQSVFGDAHWAYNTFERKSSLGQIMRFYASFLDCDVKTEHKFLYDLIPEFEQLHIIRRGEDGKAQLDIPALEYEETVEWHAAARKMKEEMYALLHDDLTAMFREHKNKVPKHVDGNEHFEYSGACGAYATAQMLEIVNRGLMPYRVVVGETPIIFLEYKKIGK